MIEPRRTLDDHTRAGQEFGPYQRMPTLTPAERMQAVVAFAQMDVETLTWEQWVDLQNTLLAVVIDSDLLQHTDMSTIHWRLPLLPDVLRGMQTDTRQFLEDLLTVRDWSLRPTSPMHTEVWMQLVPPDPSTLGRTRLVVLGQPRAVFACLLHVRLTYESPERIQRCPECRTIFYRVRKQQYCGRACANRVGVRRWRYKEANKPVAEDAGFPLG